jgi:hypothetical protein
LLIGRWAGLRNESAAAVHVSRRRSLFWLYSRSVRYRAKPSPIARFPQIRRDRCGASGVPDSHAWERSRAHTPTS